MFSRVTEFNVHVPFTPERHCDADGPVAETVPDSVPPVAPFLGAPQLPKTNKAVSKDKNEIIRLCILQILK